MAESEGTRRIEAIRKRWLSRLMMLLGVQCGAVRCGCSAAGADDALME